MPAINSQMNNISKADASDNVTSTHANILNNGSQLNHDAIQAPFNTPTYTNTSSSSEVFPAFTNASLASGTNSPHTFSPSTTAPSDEPSSVPTLAISVVATDTTPSSFPSDSPSTFSVFPTHSHVPSMGPSHDVMSTGAPSTLPTFIPLPEAAVTSKPTELALNVSSIYDSLAPENISSYAFTTESPDSNSTIYPLMTNTSTGNLSVTMIPSDAPSSVPTLVTFMPNSSTILIETASSNKTHKERMRDRHKSHNRSKTHAAALALTNASLAPKKNTSKQSNNETAIDLPTARHKGNTTVAATLSPTIFTPRREMLHTLLGISMTLYGVGEMNATTTRMFESVLQKFYQEYYRDNPWVRRRLVSSTKVATAHVYNFSTTIRVTRQTTSSFVQGGDVILMDTVTYNQTVHFVTDGSQPDPYANLIQQPFIVAQDQGLRLRERLQTHNPTAFSQLQLPLYPTLPLPREDPSHDTSTRNGLLIAGVCAGVIASLLSCWAVHQAHRRMHGMTAMEKHTDPVWAVQEEGMPQGEEEEEESIDFVEPLPFQDIEAQESDSVSSLGNLSDIGIRRLAVVPEQLEMSALELEAAMLAHGKES
jgi:hypothetical protein